MNQKNNKMEKELHKGKTMNLEFGDWIRETHTLKNNKKFVLISEVLKIKGEEITTKTILTKKAYQTKFSIESKPNEETGKLKGNKIDYDIITLDFVKLNDKQKAKYLAMLL